MAPSELRDGGLSASAAELAGLAQRALGTMSDAQRTQGLAALRSTMIRRRQTRTIRRVYGGAALGLCCAIGAAIVVRHDRRAAMSFHVDGGNLGPGGYVVAEASARPIVRFSDGSEVSLGEGARVHVRAIDAHGARVTIDEGQARVYVVHSQETRWLFDAGPFVVAVTGTAFGIGWNESRRQLDVRLENGAVTVSGPVSDIPLSLRAGQWLTVRANDVLIRDLNPLSAASSAAVPAQDALADLVPTSEAIADAATTPAPRVEPSARWLTGPAPRHVASASARQWPTDLASGKFSAIVDDATRMGLDSAFSDTSRDELAALADAARYTRRRDIARGALLAERRRFPDTSQAATTAFSLGRLSESEEDPRGALSWFENYLKEAPSGTFASEALGRIMTILQRLDGDDAARPLAETYLRRFPRGTYAEAARALTLRP